MHEEGHDEKDGHLVQSAEVMPASPVASVAPKGVATDSRFLMKFSPVSVFFMGVASSVALLFMIGFFGLLYVVVSGKSISIAEKGAVVAADLQQPTNPGEMPPAEINLAPITDKDHVRGNRKAQVVVYEFSDTECPFCKRFHPTIKEVMAGYGDKVAWVYRHFPLDQLHAKARKEAEATECAGEIAGNDGFWKLLDKIYEVTPSNDGLDLAKLPQLAKEVGIDQKKFEDCMKSGKHAKTVEEQYQSALAAGGQGTPYSVIAKGDTKVPVSGATSAEELKSIIDALLK